MRGRTPYRGPRRGGPSRGSGQYRESHSGSSNNTSSIPTTAVVVPGAAVSIVLKVDQPTGREVQGIVAELLTAGNHPRGIKVRLVDGGWAECSGS